MLLASHLSSKKIKKRSLVCGVLFELSEEIKPESVILSQGSSQESEA